MDPKRSGPRRAACTSRIPFVLRRFEERLWRILDVDVPRTYGTPGSCAWDLCNGPRRAGVTYLASEMMSKYDDGKTTDEKLSVAMSKFWEAEEGCFWTNIKFEQSAEDILSACPALERARSFVHDFFTEYVPLERLASGFGFGPGASTRLKSLDGDQCYKYSAEAEVTPNARSVAVAAISCNPMWKRMYLSEVDPPTVWGNRVTTVPKNYKTDRVIAIEPCLNMYVQKGLGSLIRHRLRAYGVDLNDQSLNQEAAADVANATIDFSMASDSVSQGVCKFLIPSNWLDIISMMRSELGVLPDGTLHRYSKVSSMGNGFTFELESLIFLALARSVVPQEQHYRIRVYGDDVIVPREYAAEFISVASYCGFSTNLKKTYVDGPFRESCGKHYHSGYDISPFYVRRPVKTLSDLFLLHNNLRRWADRMRPLLETYEYDALLELCSDLRRLAPSKWRRPRLPDGYGDDAFIGSFAECSPRVHPDGWEYFVVRTLSLTSSVDSGYNSSVPDDHVLPGLWVKTDLNFRKRRRVSPTLLELENGVEPMLAHGRRRERPVLVPWIAFS